MEERWDWLRCPKCSNNYIIFYRNGSKKVLFREWYSRFEYINKIKTKKWIFVEYPGKGTTRYYSDEYNYTTSTDYAYRGWQNAARAECWRKYRGSTEDEWNENARWECENCRWDDTDFHEFINNN